VQVKWEPQAQFVELAQPSTASWVHPFEHTVADFNSSDHSIVKTQIKGEPQVQYVELAQPEHGIELPKSEEQLLSTHRCGTVQISCIPMQTQPSLEVLPEELETSGCLKAASAHPAAQVRGAAAVDAQVHYSGPFIQCSK